MNGRVMLCYSYKMIFGLLVEKITHLTRIMFYSLFKIILSKFDFTFTEILMIFG